MPKKSFAVEKRIFLSSPTPGIAAQAGAFYTLSTGDDLVYHIIVE